MWRKPGSRCQVRFRNPTIVSVGLEDEQKASECQGLEEAGVEQSNPDDLTQSGKLKLLSAGCQSDWPAVIRSASPVPRIIQILNGPQDYQTPTLSLQGSNMSSNSESL